MRLFLDTEFNGFKGQLISIGICGEDRRSFYGVVDLPHFVDPWVTTNVVHKLFLKDTQRPVEYDLLRANLFTWLTRYRSPEFIVDWPSDPLYLFQLLLGDSHAQTMFYDMTVRVMSFKNQAFASRLPHNALYDARGMRDSFLGREIQEGEEDLTIVGNYDYEEE